MAVLDQIEYKTVVADPPWQPELGATWNSRMNDKAGPQKFYKTMRLDQIIETKPRLAKQAHLYIWGINAHLDWAFELARAWGAEPVTLLTWKKPGLGAGRFRCNTEHVVVARKGPRQGNPFGFSGRSGQATLGTCFDWPRGRHSEKPDDFFQLVEKISPGPFIEMYARQYRPGWSCFGDELEPRHD